MNDRNLIGYHRATRDLAEPIAVLDLEIARAATEARKKAECESVRTIAIMGQVHGLVVGQAVEFGGETYCVAALGPTMREVILEQMVRKPLSVEPPSKPAFGSDRPYLKKKKGRS